MKNKETKKKTLVEDFGMVMTRELEGRVSDMCNLSEVYAEVGMNKGLQQGLQQAIGLNCTL